MSHPLRDIGMGSARFTDDWRARKVLRLFYADDRPTVAWFDPEYARVQKGVDAALPGMINLLQHRGERFLTQYLGGAVTSGKREGASVH